GSGIKLGNATIGNGPATLGFAFNTPVDHPITASYNGDGNFNSTQTTAAYIQKVRPGTVTTVVAKNAAGQIISSSVSGEKVTFQASVTAPAGGTPTGKVQFFINGVLQATVTLSAGKASLTRTLSGGTYQIAAKYLPATPPSFASSTGTLTHTVTPG